MKCKIRKTSAADIAAWVTRDTFIANVDQADLDCRESRVILDCYHPDWFQHDNKYFIPPAFAFINGYLRGINGRHRAILLYKHLDVIPMLLVAPETWPKDKLAEIVLREIGEREIVELPNLPINPELPKSIQHNSGDSKNVKKIVEIKIIY